MPTPAGSRRGCATAAAPDHCSPALSCPSRRRDLVLDIAQPVFPLDRSAVDRYFWMMTSPVTNVMRRRRCGLSSGPINWSDRLEPPRVYYRRGRESARDKRVAERFASNVSASKSPPIAVEMHPLRLMSWRSPTGGYRRYQMFDVVSKASVKVGRCFIERENGFLFPAAFKQTRVHRKCLRCVLFRINYSPLEFGQWLNEYSTCINEIRVK